MFKRGVAMSENMPVVESAAVAARDFFGALLAAIPNWQSRLRANPDEMSQIEQEVQALMSRGGDMVVCGLLSAALRDPSLQAKQDAFRRSFSYPLDRGRDRRVQLRLLGGLAVWMYGIYCQPRRVTEGAKKQPPGVHLDGALFGIVDGVSPGLRSRVARQACLSPSLEFAREELERSGISLDVKAVRRISYQCGEKALRLRKLLIDQWHAGTLPAGKELTGKRVSVQIDGGRTRIRGKLRAADKRNPLVDEHGLTVENAPGRSRKQAVKTYDADWREPKLLTIFVHDDQGKMDRQFKVTIDGTLTGPDALAELVAMHLHRLGAAGAASVTFCADGASWIWDRIPIIASKAGLKKENVHQVLDNCHAAHHISLALAALGLNESQRMPLYRELRTELRNGQWRKVIEDLRELAANAHSDSQARTEIAYLERHGEMGRMNYDRFTKLGIPRGSGAIESSIRRVINLRMKNNGMFWREENAEIMLQLRAQVISQRWDDCQSNIRALSRTDARTDWRWTPRPMSCKDEANSASSA
jgi:hypothetical protein